MPQRRRTPLPGFAWATGAIALAALVRFGLDPLLGDAIPFAIFLVAVVLVVWRAGFKPALFATLLGLAVSHFMFVPPRLSFKVGSPDQWISLTTFMVLAFIVCACGEAMHRARRRAEAERDANRATLTSIGDGVITTDHEGRVELLNDVAVSLTGWSADEAKGKALDEVFRVVDEETRLPVENPVGRVLSGELAVGLTHQALLVAKDGRELPIDDTAAAIRDGDGALFGAVLIFRDVSAQRKAHADLRDGQILWRTKTETLPQLVWTCDANGACDYLSRQWVDYTGASEADHLGDGWLHVVHPDDRQRVIDSWTATQAARTVFDSEFRLRRSDGVYRWFKTRAVPLFGDRGEVLRWVGTNTDTEDHRRTVEALARLTAESERQRRLYETILSQTPDLVYVFDLAHRFTYANQALLAMWGKTWREAIGKTFDELGYEPWHAQMHDREIDQVISTRQPIRGVVPFSGTQGRRIYDYIFVPVIGANGEVEAVAGTTRDVTDWKLAEDGLREADRRKDEFLATLAHELRGPLSPMRSAVAVLALQDLPDPAMHTAREVIGRQVQQMAVLIDDLLDVSRIALNKLELRLERVELAHVMEQALEMARPLARAAGHELKVSFPSEPVCLNVDPIRLAQVFVNLLTNACKYTNRGGKIEVSAELRMGGVLVSVRDNGIGIPVEYLPRLFDKFSQVTPALERSHGGLGLGLSLVKALVEMHGGNVVARSEGPGKGSEFIVRLPVVGEVLQPPPTPAVPRLSTTPQVASPRRILVVDDNRDSATSLALLLRLIGNEVVMAFDGLEAVNVAESFRPEVVLLDIGMPNLNGYEACRLIREHEWGKKISLIAQTGWGQAADKRRTQEAGFDSHLVKPVDPELLMRLLADLDTRRG